MTQQPVNEFASMYDELQRRYEESLVTRHYATHPFPDSCLDETCHACRNSRYSKADTPATHKLGEETGPPNIHNLTAYVCCAHFRQVMGHCTHAEAGEVAQARQAELDDPPLRGGIEA